MTRIPAPQPYSERDSNLNLARPTAPAGVALDGLADGLSDEMQAASNPPQSVIDSRLGPHVLRLGAAVSELLSVTAPPPASAASAMPQRRAEHAARAAGAAAAVEEALLQTESAFYDARAEMYYSEKEADEALLFGYSPSMARYHFLLCLQLLAHAALRGAHKIAARELAAGGSGRGETIADLKQPSPTPIEAPRPPVPWRGWRSAARVRSRIVGALRAKTMVGRLRYAVKIAVSMVVAGAAGVYSSGSGIWAAEAVAMVSTRDGVFTGGHMPPLCALSPVLQAHNPPPWHRQQLPHCSTPSAGAPLVQLAKRRAKQA